MPTKPIPLIRTLIQVVVIWIASDAGYYVLLPLLGLQSDYNISPVSITLYYIFWTVIAINTFWHIFNEWKPIKDRRYAYTFLLFSFAGLILFVSFALLRLPSIVWTESWDPPELMVANQWYFLPKSIEILLQQLLIAVLVIAFSSQKFSIRTISFWCMFLFGGAHLLLAFGGAPFLYVVRFTVSAMVFGFIFPNLILRVPNGFVYSYTLHWLYYVVTVIMAHTISPYAV